MKGIWGNLATGVIAGAFLCTSALATTVGAGQFNLDGSAVGNMSGITFSFAGNNNTAVNVTPDTGAFSDLQPGGSVQTIQALTVSNGVTPGSSFDFKNWVQLTDGIDLDATSIPIPTSVPVCTGAEAVGQSCRPNAASPVIFTQTVSGVVAKLTVDGVAHTGLNGTDYLSFVGVFSTPSSNYSTVPDFLAAFSSPAGANVSFASSFIVSGPSSSVPEPGSMILLASGLLGFGILRRRKTSR